jgi:hypothetical protein
MAGINKEKSHKNVFALIDERRIVNMKKEVFVKPVAEVTTFESQIVMVGISTPIAPGEWD